MSILGILLVLVIFGFILWLVFTFIPMPPPIKQVITVVVVLLLILWLVGVLGLVPSLTAPIHPYYYPPPR